MPTALPLKVIGWSVWYEDSFYTSHDTRWGDLPDDGVQVMYLYKSDGRRLHCSGDSSYFHVPPDVWGSNRDEPNEVRKRYPGAIVKRGKWTSLEKLQAIEKKAVDYQWQ